MKNGLRVLSKRECEVADHISRGISNRDLAIVLQITEKTVEKHISRIFRKLGLRSRAQLAIYVLSDDGREVGARAHAELVEN
jgi:DNA-binding NarL/FixJ family response regulator